jgi:HK97 family phage major capsid protein
MNRLQEIEERLAAIREEIERRGEGLNEDEFTTFDTEVKGLKEERERLIRANEDRARLLNEIAEQRTAGTVTRTFTGPGATGRQQQAEDDPLGSMEYRRAFMSHVLKGAPIPEEFRADAITKTTDIGTVIPTTTLNKIIEKMESVGMILPLVTHTAYKGGLVIPTSSVKPVATWVAEGQGSDKQKKTTGSIAFTYHKLRCAVAVTLEVDTMALSAFESALINNVTEAMVKALEQAIISGTGIGQPKGILAETVPSGQALTSDAPSYENLIDAEAALPQAYENGAIWVMSKKTFMKFLGLQDETGQPIGRVDHGIGGKLERSLLGRSVVTCDYVTPYISDMNAGTVFAFLFDMKSYVLNTNYTMAMKRYEDNETDNMISRAVMLVDGRVVDANSLVTLAKSAPSSGS